MRVGAGGVATIAATVLLGDWRGRRTLVWIKILVCVDHAGSSTWIRPTRALVVHPVILGAGKPFLPALRDRIGLRLFETRTFVPGVVYLGYETVR
jgi:hypothetical protein